MSTTAIKHNLCETVAFGEKPEVDEESGVIRGVKILGENSKNGRRYTPKAMREAVALYEGTKCYLNHPKRSELTEDRDWAKWAGVFEGVHYREGRGLFGDVRLRKEGQHFKEIIEAARDFPKDTGFSHVADGKSRREGKSEIVESIREVFSVDLVTDPATTKGFFESHQPGPKTMKTTLKELIESIPKSVATRKLLVEAIETKQVADDLAIELADDADDAAKVSAAMESFAKAAIEKLKATPEPEPKAESDSELAKKVAFLEAKTLLLESGREASDVRIKALAGADEADRKDLLESWPKIEAKQSSRRPASSPPIRESEGDDAEGLADFEKSWSESVSKARETLKSKAV